MTKRIPKKILDQLPSPKEIAAGLGDELLEAETKLRHGGKSLGLYRLEGHTPVPVEDTIAWARFYEKTKNRRVAGDHINGWFISTVFLGIDSNPFGSPPLLFETMIFSETEQTESPILKKKYPKSLNNYQRRYATWDEALAGHQEATQMVREGAQ